MIKPEDKPLYERALKDILVYLSKPEGRHDLVRMTDSDSTQKTIRELTKARMEAYRHKPVEEV